MKDRSGVAVIAVAVAALGGAVMTSRHVQAEDQAVYINSSGGAFDEVNRKVFWDPFTQATGIKVISSAPVDGAKLKAMVTTGNVEWDIANIDGNVLLPYVRQGLLTKLDLSKLPTSDLLKEAVTDYSILTTWTSTVLAWNTEVFPLSGKHPSSLMDLWNQKEFPGPPCLAKDAIDNLELGELHAGVPRDKIYPIDQDKAYRELDKLKDDVSVWWTTGAQSVQALVNRDCVMGTAWNGRPYQLVVKDKAPLAVAWGDAILRPNRWVIPKGAKHHHNAMKLIAWMQDAHRQAEAAKLGGCAGGNNNVAALLPAEVQDYLATSPEHLKMSLVSNDDWWGQNGPAAYKRFTGWVIGK